MTDEEVLKMPAPSADAPTKLTDWKNEPTMLDIQNDFEMAKQSHSKQMAKIQHWVSLLEAPKKTGVPKGRSSVQPKMIRRQAEWRYSALTEPFLSEKDPFSVEPVTFEDTEAAKQNELLLNYQFRSKLNRVKFIDTYVRSTVDEGTCIVRLGWTRQTKKVKEIHPVYEHFAIEDEEEAGLLQQAADMKKSNPRIYNDMTDPAIKAAVDYFLETGQPTTAVQVGEEEIEVEKVLVNQPELKPINPSNFYPDPTCDGDLLKALYGIYSFETNKAELLKTPDIYKNLDQVDWAGATVSTDPDHVSGTSDSMQFRDAVRKKIIAYEYWGLYDIHGTGELVPVVITWIGTTIIRMSESPFSDKRLPFVVVPYLPIKRELYGETDAELLEDNQAIAGAVTRGMIDLLGRSANSQRGFAKGLLDPVNRHRYDAGKDYEFNPTQHPGQSIHEHKYPELPQSALAMLGLQNQEAEAMTGVKAFSGGISGSSYGDVAAGVRGALDAASKREMAILRRLAQGMVEIGQRIISMNADFLSEEEVVRVTNTEFVTIRREDLPGQFDLKVDISTAEVDERKAQELAFMLQTLGNTVDSSITLMILAEIADLKSMPALAEKLRQYQPPPPSEAQQKMEQLQIERMELENDELRSKAELNRAKAEAEISRKDTEDLNFLERNNGIEHQRKLELQQGQAEGNKELEVTKALTRSAKEGEREPDFVAAIGYNTITSPSKVENIDNGAQNIDLAPMAPASNPYQ